MPYTMDDKLLDLTSVVLGASETNTVVSEVVRISDEDSRCINIDITAASTTVATGITAKLQDSAQGGALASWNDNGTVSITGDGVFTIDLLAEASGDQANLPLRPYIRVVVSTGVGDAATISKVLVSKRRSR